MDKFHNYKRCAYCGSAESKTQKEHAIPRNLYPQSKNESRIQRITIPACSRCNNGWADDEAHFRNVLLLAGEPNDVVHELYNTKLQRSFKEKDGKRRVLEIVDLFVPIETASGLRQMIYPDRDPRVVRIIKKIIRGLAHHHKVQTAVKEENVWAEILKFPFPEKILDYHHQEQDIIEYWYTIINEENVNSVWVLKFFNRTVFTGYINSSN